MVLPLFLVAFLAGCGTDDTLPETGNSSVPGNSGTPSSEVELVSETTPIPDGYEQEAEQRGSIVRVDYNTRDYAEGSGAARTNTAYVYLPKLLDQMIAHGDIDPMIVVTPTYNYGQPTANYTDADPYCRALPQELVNDLIPVVESRYRTYAETTDAEGIEASREHRAIGGFSMGAVTTWYAFDETLDAFKWFMPISGLPE